MNLVELQITLFAYFRDFYVKVTKLIKLGTVWQLNNCYQADIQCEPLESQKHQNMGKW